MKRKYISGVTWKELCEYTSKYMHIDDIHSGYISLIKVHKIKQKVTVDYEASDVTLLDEGYKCLMFLPDKEKWCLSIVYDASEKVVEWYFDMTKENSVDEEGNPYYDDLYLDIAVSPDFKVAILDEDELKEALDANIITQSDYDIAYETCNKILKEIIPDQDFLVSHFNKYIAELEH